MISYIAKRIKDCIVDKYFGLRHVNICLDDYKNRDVIFCINPGRSGSQYFAELLNTSKEIFAYHEPYPTMTSRYIDMVNKYPYDISVKNRNIKNLGIIRLMQKFDKDMIYCETSNMFIKTFFDVVLKIFRNARVIILRRYLPDVIRSFIELQYHSICNLSWYNWMTNPNAITRAIDCVYNNAKLDQYDLIIAYLIDIEARTQRFITQYQHVPTISVRLERLNQKDYVRSLFNQLQISYTEETDVILGVAKNKRLEKKNKKIDVEYCKYRFLLYLDKASEKGIIIPKSLAMDQFN